MIDVQAGREAYQESKIDNIGWIKSYGNLADGLTKINKPDLLQHVIRTGKLTRTADQWVIRPPIKEVHHSSSSVGTNHMMVQLRRPYVRSNLSKINQSALGTITDLSFEVSSFVFSCSPSRSTLIVLFPLPFISFIRSLSLLCFPSLLSSLLFTSYFSTQRISHSSSS